jgi:hypothetical protein
MEQIAVVIKAARRAVNGDAYLKETVCSFERSIGKTTELLHSLQVSWTEGPVTSIGKDWETVLGYGDGQFARLTLHQNAARSIRLAATAGAEWAMVIEDDIDFCDDFLGSTLRWVHDVEATGEKFPMYVLGANYAQIQAARHSGQIFWHYPCKAFYGNQALLWRADVAQRLGEWLGPDPSYNGVRDHGHDLLLQRWGHEKMKADCFCASVPSFVEHVGEKSGIGNRHFHFPSWPGRDWKYETPTARPTVKGKK